MTGATNTGDGLKSSPVCLTDKDRVCRVSVGLARFPITALRECHAPFLSEILSVSVMFPGG